MRRKVWVLQTYLDAVGVEHTRRLRGVRFGSSRFGRVYVLYRDAAGACTWGKVRPYRLRARDA